MMQKPTIKEYKAMMEGATDAPWEVSFHDYDNNGLFYTIDTSKNISDKQADYTAKFIAASRNIAPSLIRVIKLAEKALEHYSKNVTDPMDLGVPVSQGGVVSIVDNTRIAKQALSEIRKLNG